MKNGFQKLRLIVQELELSLLMCRKLHDDFSRRTFARHILIRAKDFITHSRKLRKPLIAAGFDVKSFHEQKEIYADAFAEYFQVSRDKISGHVQDLDFHDRIGLWNQIEIQKVEYFVDSALHIYRNTLGSLNIPDYQLYDPLQDFRKAELVEVLENFSRLKKSDTAVRMASDPLAMTRPNTVSALNLTPVHSRASQLALIKLWMDINLELFGVISIFTDCQRILKSRLVTDIISFGDGLITRRVDKSAPQSMKGLDILLEESGNTSTVLKSIASIFRYKEETDKIRRLRNLFGAHLSVEPTILAEDIISEIDNFNLSEALETYQSLKGAFDRTCREVFFLITYTSDGVKLGGLMAGEPSSLVPFDKANPVPIPRKTNPGNINNLNDLSENLNTWLNDGEDSEEARLFFWDACLEGTEVETLLENRILGSMTQVYRHKFTISHQFLLAKIIEEKDVARVTKILNLMLDCKAAGSFAYTEIISRYALHPSRIVTDIEIISALGKIASKFQLSAMALIKNFLNSSDLYIRINAVVALHQILVRSEDLNQKEIMFSFARDIEPHLSSFSREYKLLLHLIFASQFLYSLNVYYKKLESYYQFLSQEIAIQVRVIIRSKGHALHGGSIKNLLDGHDYVGLSLYLSNYFDSLKKSKFSELFLSAAVRRIIESNQNLQSQMNYVACLLKYKDYASAIVGATALADRHPDLLDVQLFLIEILGSCPGRELQALEKLTRLESKYNFDEESIKRAQLIKSELRKD
nr:hypothetical protein [uncultured Bdellovibrio sp.]